MGEFKKEVSLKEEISKAYNYKINKEKHEKIIKDFPHVSSHSRYRTHLKIAVVEHAKFVNQLPEKTKALIKPPKHPKRSFLILREGVWEPNYEFVKKCIAESFKSGQTVTFEFFNANIVLDQLIDKLKNRNK